MSNYRIKSSDMHSNVPEDTRICGMFAVSSTSGALGTIVRPSAGSTAAAGAGNLWTAAQVTTNKYLWSVTLAETYVRPVFVSAQYALVPTSANSGTGGFNKNNPVALPTVPSATLLNNAGSSALDAYVTAVDAPINTTAADGSNSFYIFLADGSGAIPTSAPTVPTGYTIMIQFECSFNNTISPNSR